MTRRLPLADLAPRDVVAKAIMNVMAETGTDHIFLDGPHLGEAVWAHRFPTIRASCLSHGIDPVTDPIPVVPAAHYASGGIRTDLRGRTNIGGLYACGEAACTGVHGANRLASNSLLEGLVFAERIAARPANRDKIMAIHPKAFIATMELWRSYFMRSIDLPVIGATEQDLRSIRVPTLVVPGNDRTHSLAIGRKAQRLIPNSELFELYTEDKDVDIVPPEEWDAREDVMAKACVDFLQRHLAPART